MLRKEFSVSSVDLRETLATSSQVMNEIYGRLNIEFIDGTPLSVRGKVKLIPGPEVRRILCSRGFVYKKRCQVVSFMMCKGGVGKTTSSYFLSQRLASFGFKVLAIDMDTQGSLTSAFDLDRMGYEIDPETPVISDIVSGKCMPDKAVVEITNMMHLIPSTPLNANLDSKIRDSFKNVSLALKKTIVALKEKYDFVIIDCAPALNLTNTAAVCVSDIVVMPVSPDKFSQIGLEQTIGEIMQIEEDFGISVDKKILFTKYDAREFLSYKYLAEIADSHNDKRLKTAIRTCADVKNVLTKHENLFSLRRSHAKADYDDLAKEFCGLLDFSISRKKASRDAA